MLIKLFDVDIFIEEISLLKGRGFKDKLIHGLSPTWLTQPNSRLNPTTNPPPGYNPVNFDNQNENYIPALNLNSIFIIPKKWQHCKCQDIFSQIIFIFLFLLFPESVLFPFISLLLPSKDVRNKKNSHKS